MLVEEIKLFDLLYLNMLILFTLCSFIVFPEKSCFSGMAVRRFLHHTMNPLEVPLYFVKYALVIQEQQSCYSV